MDTRRELVRRVIEDLADDVVAWGYYGTCIEKAVLAGEITVNEVRDWLGDRVRKRIISDAPDNFDSVTAELVRDEWGC